MLMLVQSLTHEPGAAFPIKCICIQRRLRSACEYSQADKSLRCPPEDALDSWLLTECPAKTLIRHLGCAGGPVSSLVLWAHMQS